jgi:hypothetical protein
MSKNNRKEYYIGSGDYFGNNKPNDKFNKEMVPYLKTLKLKEKDIDKIAKYVEFFYGLGYSNGVDNEACATNEY